MLKTGPGAKRMSELHTPLEDLGTPRPREASGRVRLQIDGQQIQVDAGSSVMRAAALIGINVPKLCATDSLDAFGSCRLCLVEIEGRKAMMTKHLNMCKMQNNPNFSKDQNS